MRDLTPMMQPKTVAVIGASSNPKKVGGRPIVNMQNKGFAGEIYPINNKRGEVHGLKTYPSISAVGKPIDLAVVAVPAADVEAAITEGIGAGVRSFVVFSSGFAEHNAEASAMQDRLSALAREHGTPILGPNCLGAINLQTGLIASFATALESIDPDAPTGVGPGLGIVSQSGAMAAWWLAQSENSGIGVTSWITTGNECDVDVADGIAYLATDPATKVIAVYSEGLRDFTRFADAVGQAHRAGKPVIVIKGGGTAEGAQAAKAHTGAVGGSDAEYDALFERCGAIRVNSLSGALGAAKLWLAFPKGKPIDRLGVITNSGGAGVLLADAASDAGFALTEFSEPIERQIEEFLPYYAKPRNPLDVTGGIVAKADVFGKMCAILGGADEHDFYIIATGLLHSVAADMIAGIEAGLLAKGKPMAVVWVAAPRAIVEPLESAGIPVFSDLAHVIEAVSLYDRACRSVDAATAPG